jgi:hypothetical protein
MRPIVGEFRVYGANQLSIGIHSSSTVTGAYGKGQAESGRSIAVTDSTYTCNHLLLHSALLGNNYSGEETAGKNVAQPVVIYLGIPA